MEEEAYLRLLVVEVEYQLDLHHKLATTLHNLLLSNRPFRGMTLSNAMIPFGSSTDIVVDDMIVLTTHPWMPPLQRQVLHTRRQKTATSSGCTMAVDNIDFERGLFICVKNWEMF